jgi:hypothetical protein
MTPQATHLRSPSLTMFVEVSAGADITNAAEEALYIANQLRCWVEFNFNDVSCFVAPNSRPVELAEAYHKALADKGPVRNPRRAYARSHYTGPAVEHGEKP